MSSKSLFANKINIFWINNYTHRVIGSSSNKAVNIIDFVYIKARQTERLIEEHISME